MENADKALATGSKRVYDVPPSAMFAEFMKTGWAPTPLDGITQGEVISYCLGFAIATILLHAVGITSGLGFAKWNNQKLVQLTGASIALCGIYLLVL